MVLVKDLLDLIVEIKNKTCYNLPRNYPSKLCRDEHDQYGRELYNHWDCEEDCDCDDEICAFVSTCDNPDQKQCVQLTESMSWGVYDCIKYEPGNNCCNESSPFYWSPHQESTQAVKNVPRRKLKQKQNTTTATETETETCIDCYNVFHCCSQPLG